MAKHNHWHGAGIVRNTTLRPQKSGDLVLAFDLHIRRAFPSKKFDKIPVQMWRPPEWAQNIPDGALVVVTGALRTERLLAKGAQEKTQYAFINAATLYRAEKVFDAEHPNQALYGW